MAVQSQKQKKIEWNAIRAQLHTKANRERANKRPLIERPAKEQQATANMSKN